MTWALPPSPGGRGGCGRWRFSKHLTPHEELSVPTSPHVPVTSGDAVPERTPSRFSSLVLQRNPPVPPTAPGRPSGRFGTAHRWQRGPPTPTGMRRDSTKKFTRTEERGNEIPQHGLGVLSITRAPTEPQLWRKHTRPLLNSRLILISIVL